MKEIKYEYDYADFNTTTITGIDTTNLNTCSNSFTIAPKAIWMPDACERPKYFPVWHLVKSYPKHKCELAEFGEIDGIMTYDWYCKYCMRDMN